MKWNLLAHDLRFVHVVDYITGAGLLREKLMEKKNSYFLFSWQLM